MIETIILIYGLISLTYLFNQINFSHAEYLNNIKTKPQYPTTVAIIIPTYNETPTNLTNCIKSCQTQHYPGNITIHVIDDGSKNKTAIQEAKKIPGIHTYELPTNQGKRQAQKTALDNTNAEIIVTIDSDTILDPNAITELTRPFNNPQVGATTGEVTVTNRNKKLLSRLLDTRYWTAFNQERASQSYFNTVLCCSGPLSAYRNKIIQQIKHKYTTQTFLNQKCTYGDDRHLTNLVIQQGWHVKYTPHAKAKTEVPPTLQKWTRQQLRWNLSFYRELFVTTKYLLRNPKMLHPYIIYDLTMQTILPYYFILALTYSIHKALTQSLLFGLGYTSIIIGISLIRSLYSITRTQDKNFLLTPLYALLHITLLIPIRTYALITTIIPTQKNWGTR